MKTNRRRYDLNTRHLLWFERCIERALASGDLRQIERVLEKLQSKIDALDAIRTSKELDYLLQLTMLFVTARLASQSSTPEGKPYKATIAVHYPQHRAISVKPSFYSPGRCFVQHTTISLAPGQQIGLAGRIGHSGLSLLHGHVLYCPLQRDEERSCCQYVSLKRDDQLRARTALCIPLKPGVREVIAAFSTARVGGGDKKNFCRVGAAECDCSEEKVRELIEKKSDQRIESLAVFNLECATADLRLDRAREILADGVIVSLLEKVTRSIEGYIRDRGKYKVVRTCTSLFELSQHNLSIRETYRALMQEVSRICGGADVTLHLRDLPTLKDDVGRCINLVTGVGSNFRGFLVNERYGLEEGLVGSVLSQGESDYVTKPQIDEALTADEPSKPFKQLMPRSCLNLAVPLKFHDFAFGVLNIEWDELCKEAAGVADLLVKLRPLVERLGAYFSQVVDFYEDRENPLLHPKNEQELHLRREVVQRQMMDYHVQGAIKNLENMKPVRNEATSDEAGYKAYLKNLIDAVGYLVGFDSDFRIMVSLRKLIVKEGLEVLHLIVDHGLPRFEWARRDLPVEVGTSVLGTCAELGVPLFGEVIERSTLRPDALCLSLLRGEERAVLDQKEICYATCGQAEPRYEVALPLLFGGKVMGTLDFELFAAEERGGRDNRGRTVPHLKRYELLGFLDWARAIAFCMALYEDQNMSHGLNQEEKQGISRFQRLCAQVIANIRLPAKQAEGIAAEYFHELIPFDDLSIVRFDETGSAASEQQCDNSQAKRVSRKPLKFRGRHLGELLIDPGAKDDLPKRCIFPDHRGEGPGSTVRRLMAAYFTSNLLTVQHPSEGSRELVESLQRIRRGIESSEGSFSDPEYDAGKMVEELFHILRETFEEEFNLHNHSKMKKKDEKGKENNNIVIREPGRYAWFLFIVRMDPQTGASSLRCGEPWKRWAGADTEDMKTHIEAVRRWAEADRENVLRTILVRAGRKKDMEDLVARAASGGYSQAALREVFTEVLAEKEYPAPGAVLEPAQGVEEISFTRHVAASQKVQVSIDFSMSPLRSPRDTRWFYTKPYSMLGIPIVLGGRAIGVLNILRRRDDRDDFLFFSNEELKAVDEFKDFLSGLLRKHVDCRELPDVVGERRLADLPSWRRLAEQLRQALKNGRRIITVECSFAENIREIREIFLGVDRDAHIFDQRSWAGFIGRMTNPDGVIVLSISDIPSGRCKLILREAASKSRKLVIFFLPKDRFVRDLLPEIPQPLELRESQTELEGHLLNRMSEEWRFDVQGHRDGSILFRRRGTTENEKSWSIADAAADLGGSAIQIHLRMPNFLSRQLASDVSPWRGFADWFVYHRRFEEISADYREGSISMANSYPSSRVVRSEQYRAAPRRRYSGDLRRSIRILHLSDLHMEDGDRADVYRAQLETDLIQELKIDGLEYLAISGDIANYATEEEYNAAFAMVDGLAKRFELDPSQILIVPGNHDVNWELSKRAYTFVYRDELPSPLLGERHILLGEKGALLRNDSMYRKRFDPFNVHFYRRVYNKDYPLESKDQALWIERPEHRLVFLGLNSCWQLDHEFRERASIDPHALSPVVDRLQTRAYDGWLKIAVWHHPVTGPQPMSDHFMQLLAVHRFQVCLHGHIHEASEGFYKYDDRRELRIIAAGTFGAPVKQQVPAIPLQYNLLAFDTGTGEMTVHTRKKEKPEGAWSADARWGDQNDPKPWYKFQVPHYKPRS